MKYFPMDYKETKRRSQALAEFISDENCGSAPTRRPTECCEDVNRLVKDDYISACSADCGSDQCCQGNCLAKYIRILKDGNFDKDTALSSMKEAFAGDQEWVDVRLKFSEKFRLLQFYFFAGRCQSR